MNEVVLRCPNCGTTQNAADECDTCHEAQVRYFCPNHTPGRWLDGPACLICGATVGRGPTVRTAEPPPSAGTVPPGPVFSERPTPTTPPRRARRVERPPTRAVPPPWRPPEPTPRNPIELFRRSPRAARSAGTAGPSPGPAAGPAAGRAARPGLPFVGCVVRLLLVLGILLLLAVAALWLVAGGAVREWALDVGQSTGVVGGVPAQTARGIAAYRNRDYALAERELGEAARTYPRSALALLYLARIRGDAGDLERAGEYLREAVSREPDNPIAHRQLGEYYLRSARQLRADPAAAPQLQPELAAAEEQFSRALLLDPADQRARGYDACALAALGLSAEATTALAAAGPGPWETCARTGVP